ncbi:MAG: hypothetical protein QHJ73_07260, partial [Armatimonadota bacterium]|nr:hypothetical protein [Armatimonadota bacterium]
MESTVLLSALCAVLSAAPVGAQEAGLSVWACGPLEKVFPEVRVSVLRTSAATYYRVRVKAADRKD